MPCGLHIITCSKQRRPARLLSEMSDSGVTCTAHTVRSAITHVRLWPFNLLRAYTFLLPKLEAIQFETVLLGVMPCLFCGRIYLPRWKSTNTSDDAPPSAQRRSHRILNNIAVSIACAGDQAQTTTTTSWAGGEYLEEAGAIHDRTARPIIKSPVQAHDGDEQTLRSKKGANHHW